MARKIGVFGSQQQVIDAIEQLEQAGFTKGELKVLAKDAEHSRRIEAESDVHADEMREMAQTDDHQYGHGYGSLGMGEAAGFGGPGTVAALGAGASGSGTALGGFPAAIAALTLSDTNEYSSTLHALGLDDEETKICSEALSEGSLVLIVETDESKSMLDKDGGPDLSRLGAAEAVFRGSGASLIVAGA